MLELHSMLAQPGPWISHIHAMNGLLHAMNRFQRRAESMWDGCVRHSHGPRLPLAVVCLITLAALCTPSAFADELDAEQPPLTSSSSPTSLSAIDALNRLGAEMRRARASADWRAYLIAAKHQ